MRQAHSPDVITASVPVDTLPVSVTGRECRQGCAHCGGHYLAGMRPLAEARPGDRQSVLISGGCDGAGRVPVSQHLEALQSLTASRRSNWHLGLIGPEELDLVQPLLDVVSFDFVGDDRTLREVYGLDAGADEVERSFAVLSARARVVPHITIGLRGGAIGHEWAALERLTRHRFDTLVLLVLIPTPGTAYAEAQPPTPEDAARVIAAARARFPEVSLHLGCMRPRGDYRPMLDDLAVRAGVNLIVNPARSAVALAESLGLAWQQQRECCVFASGA